MNNFQRDGSISNAHVGREFESIALNYLNNNGFQLRSNLSLPVGVGSEKKMHSFDLGDSDNKIIVECKSHKWTAPSDNVPSAKMTVWNEAMYYFAVSSNEYRKILFVLRHYSNKRGETLAEYYIRIYSHLIPSGTEIWEYDDDKKLAIQLIKPQ